MYNIYLEKKVVQVGPQAEGLGLESHNVLVTGERFYKSLKFRLQVNWPHLKNPGLNQD